MTAIRLPWPPPVLSPNNRGHWAVKARAGKRAHVAAFFATKAAFVAVPEAGDIVLSITAHPPHNRKYDRDNLLARLKKSLDGIADALRVDDVRFVPLPVKIGERKPGGEVVIRIMGAE